MEAREDEITLNLVQKFDVYIRSRASAAADMKKINQPGPLNTLD